MFSRFKYYSDMILVAFFAVIIAALLMTPTGFEERVSQNAIRCKGEVIETDNSNIQQFGIVKKGEQEVSLRILNGPFKGELLEGQNQLMGQMDRDKVFAPGDVALVVLSLDEDGKIVFVNPQAHYRIGIELFLFFLFALLLIVFGGWTGTKALLSFIFAGLMIWKIVIPLMLKGWDPVMLALVVVAIMTASVIFLVAGLTRKGAVAFCGAFLGVLTSAVLAIYFTQKLHVHGAVMPFAETLLYSGFGHLDLIRIYTAAVFFSASGAVMDLAMDVSASMQEVVEKKPDIHGWDLLKSGMTVGRAVVGTMTTTLLLAYSGGFITLLMAFMAQGVPLVNIFNLIYVAAEVLKTLVGSFGLVTVAPFTAVIGSFIYTSKKTRRLNTSSIDDIERAPSLTGA